MMSQTSAPSTNAMIIKTRRRSQVNIGSYSSSSSSSRSSAAGDVGWGDRACAPGNTDPDGGPTVRPRDALLPGQRVGAVLIPEMPPDSVPRGGTEGVKLSPAAAESAASTDSSVAADCSLVAEGSAAAASWVAADVRAPQAGARNGTAGLAGVIVSGSALDGSEDSAVAPGMDGHTLSPGAVCKIGESSPVSSTVRIAWTPAGGRTLG